MRIFCEENRKTVISRLDPRSRLVFALAWAFLIVMLQQWTALGFAFLLTLVLAGAARAFNRSMLRRLVELDIFALFLLVFIPLSVPGAALLTAGSLEWTLEGAVLALRIAARANVIMLICSALVSTMEPSTLAHGLYRLGLSAKLAHALFFCVRYLEVLHLEYHRLRNAMKLRGFRARCNRHVLRSLGYLVGMLFVRSVDRSNRVLEAMKCRGFSGRLYSLSEFKFQLLDESFALFMVSSGAVAVWLEWMM